MKFAALFFALTAFSSAMAATLTCEGAGERVLIEYSSPSEIRVSLRGETALADGLVTRSEIDLIARFPSQGEMTIYAMVGKKDPSNYIFLNGRRNPVFCR
jgi:hypothetical protein